MSGPAFAVDGGVDIACIMRHPDEWQHTLAIQSDEENDERELNVSITIVTHGQPEGNITVSRADVVTALGGRMPMSSNVDTDPRFYITPLRKGELGASAYGAETVGIVDKNAGGIIAYAHTDNAARIVRALSEMEG